MGGGKILYLSCMLGFITRKSFATTGIQQNVLKTNNVDIRDREQGIFKLSEGLVKDLIERVQHLESENRHQQVKMTSQEKRIDAMNIVIAQQQLEIDSLKRSMDTQTEKFDQSDATGTSSQLLENGDENGSGLTEELSQSANTYTTGLASQYEDENVARHQGKESIDSIQIFGRDVKHMLLLFRIKMPSSSFSCHVNGHDKLQDKSQRFIV